VAKSDFLRVVHPGHAARSKQDTWGKQVAAARAAFFTLRRAAVRCLELAIASPLLRDSETTILKSEAQIFIRHIVVRSLALRSTEHCVRVAHRVLANVARPHLPTLRTGSSCRFLVRAR
jgi:hypothetical protein